MTVAIGVDPSLVATGLCAVDVEARTVLDWKCIRTKPDPKLKPTEDLVRRIFEVAEGVRDFCAQHRGIIVIESQAGWSPKGKQERASGLLFMLGTGYGACIGALPSKPIVMHPATIKARVMKNRDKTTKDAAWEAVQHYFSSFPKEPTNKVALEAVHDAVIATIAALPEIDQLRQLLPRTPQAG